jgi:peptide deformylase
MFNTDGLYNQIKAMYATMKYNNGIGISSPQLDYPFETKTPNRIIVTNVEDNFQVFINPFIIYTEGEFTFNEGCLSLPGYFSDIKRTKIIHIAYQDPQGQQIEAKMTNIYATVFQHEYDHLNGHLFIDDLSYLKRKFAENKIKKQVKKIKR